MRVTPGVRVIHRFSVWGVGLVLGAAGLNGGAPGFDRHLRVTGTDPGALGAFFLLVS